MRTTRQAIRHPVSASVEQVSHLCQRGRQPARRSSAEAVGFDLCFGRSVRS
jgi:hypothetical protein